ncbi:Lrp/AsnC family transcriptional regulator [Alphaproteobacteria bacterium]|nr:Lrp/AsnC family transcriptional regulator [Alphaproteobacteria bacterium]MDC0624778.1 Lrp/AsnC family transcriptional regulator [Alphaproteobacteria bacterium]|tara:strand:- start:606 stop:1067 length:462 start_codon:yes stop_codon:yes gene_type:complete
MDDIDKKILEELQKNSSQPLSELSKKVGLSNTPCWNRIKKLEEEKIIKSKSIIIDNRKINLPITVFLSVSIQNHTEKWLKNFEKIVNKYDQIIEVHRLTGSNSDYQITILSPSIEEYDKFQQILIKEIECTNMTSHISLQTIKKNYKYPLNYI